MKQKASTRAKMLSSENRGKSTSSTGLEGTTTPRRGFGTVVPPTPPLRRSQPGLGRGSRQFLDSSCQDMGLLRSSIWGHYDKTS